MNDTDPVNFDLKTANRIVAAVKRAEKLQPPDITSDDNPQIQAGGWWAEITGAYDDTAGQNGYPWKMVNAGDTAYTMMTSPTGATGIRLVSPNGDKGLMSGQRVFINLAGYDSGNPWYLILPAIPHAPFYVNLSTPSATSSTGGISYTVKTIDDAYTLGTKLTPTSNNIAHRIAAGTWYAPCTAGAKNYIGNGEGYFSPITGGFVLQKAFETLTPYTCSA